MVFYSNKHLDLAPDKGPYDDAVKVEVTERWLALIMENNFSYHWDGDSDIPEGESEMYCERHLSLKEVENLIKALEAARDEFFFRLK